MTERVTLLSMYEVEEYARKDGFILHPTITKEAAASDDSSWYSAYLNSGAPDYIWVTKTPCEYNKCDVYYVESCEGHEVFCLHHAAASGFGIRPVITIDLNALDAAQVSGDGTNAQPYVLLG